MLLAGFLYKYNLSHKFLFLNIFTQLDLEKNIMVKNEMVEIKQIRGYLKRQLLNDKSFLGHEKEKDQIFDLIQKTIQFGESNSALLIGPRGCGKTTVSQHLEMK